MISTVIDICKNVIELIRQNQDIKKENIERISGILEEISKVLDDTAQKLSEDIYPHNNCVVMERLAKELHFNLLDYLPPEEIDVLYNSLMESSQVEKEFALRKETETIPKIEKASGEFRAMSLLLKMRYKKK